MFKNNVTREDIKFHEEKHNFSKDKSFDYDKITEYIYLGTNICCEIGYSKELLNKNIVADISLEEKRIDNPFGVDYFLWLPTKDHYPPSLKQIELGVRTIDFFVKNNIKFYIHCKNGHGRAPTLIAAYFIKQGKGVEEALEFIKSKRPSIHTWDSQIKALKKYKKLL